MQVERRVLAWVLGVVVVAAMALGGCAGSEAPEVQVDDAGDADPVLVEGRELWTAQCSRCHGADGSGGAGPDVRGPWSSDRQPDATTMATIIAEGRGAMPGFGGELSDDEIDAIVRYVREVL